MARDSSLWPFTSRPDPDQSSSRVREFEAWPRGKAQDGTRAFSLSSGPDLRRRCSALRCSPAGPASAHPRQLHSNANGTPRKCRGEGDAECASQHCGVRVLSPQPRVWIRATLWACMRMCGSARGALTRAEWPLPRLRSWGTTLLKVRAAAGPCWGSSHALKPSRSRSFSFFRGPLSRKPQGCTSRSTSEAKFQLIQLQYILHSYI